MIHKLLGSWLVLSELQELVAVVDTLGKIPSNQHAEACGDNKLNIEILIAQTSNLWRMFFFIGRLFKVAFRFGCWRQPSQRLWLYTHLQEAVLKTVQ